MRVQVRLFSHLRLSLGTRGLALELPDGSTVATVLKELSRRVGPELQRSVIGDGEDGYRLVALVNSRRAGVTSALSDGDVIALLPPLGGG